MLPNDWENFSAYYLENIGYTVLEGASVGPDGGKDLIVEKNSIRHLVSCKNNVRSNKSVTLSDEDSILDRMSQHSADVFIGFYSTRAGSNLRNYLVSSNINHVIYEGFDIAKNLKNLPFMVNQSFFHSGNITQPKIFGAVYEPLLCHCGCGCDLLDPAEIHSAKFYLFLCGSNLNLGWYLNNHIINTQCIKEFSISKCLYLKELNAVIDEIESIIDTQQYNVTTQFNEAFTQIIELSHQMIYPSDWCIS